MTYPETLDYLYYKLPMFSRVGIAAIKKDLHNTILLCERLGNPHKKFKSIHIAGTNGKGSVSHMLAAVLQTAGYKTALYTSPHLYDFRERIKVDGNMIPQEFVTGFIEKVQPWIDEIEPSFFEITVAMAFDFFAKEEVDIAVIEVGLGGRLDSTNIIYPELSIITNISLDHTNILGTTIEEIAAEKAGIIKENVPVIIGEKQALTKSIFEETALRKRASIQFAEDSFMISSFTLHPSFIHIEVAESNKKKVENYQLDLAGIYQAKNIQTVLASIKVLNTIGWQLPDDVVRSALKQVKKITGLYGRWEVLQEAPMVVLEVAHNEAGIKEMLGHVKLLSYKQLHLIIGMVKDKDIEKVLGLLPKDAIYYFTQAQIPRALDKHQLQIEANVYGLEGITFSNVSTALSKALDLASSEDIIIVCGSIFLVAEVDKAKF